MDKKENKSNKDTIIDIYESDSDHDETLQNIDLALMKDIRNNCIYVSILLGLAVIMILGVNCNATWINNIYYHRQILSSDNKRYPYYQVPDVERLRGKEIPAEIQSCKEGTAVITADQKPGTIIREQDDQCVVDMEVTTTEKTGYWFFPSWGKDTEVTQKQDVPLDKCKLYLISNFRSYTEDEWVPEEWKSEEMPDEIVNCKQDTPVMKYMNPYDAPGNRFHGNGTIINHGQFFGQCVVKFDYGTSVDVIQERLFLDPVAIQKKYGRTFWRLINLAICN